MKTLKYIFTIITIASFIACGGSDDGGDTTPNQGNNGNPPNQGNDGNPPNNGGDNPPTNGGNEEITPAKATLIFPENAKVCTTGVFVENSTDSKVIFKWNTAQDATSYEVTLINVDNSNSTEKVNFTSNEGEIVLKQDTNYAWIVTSIRGNKRVDSDRWTFYNSAEGEKNFAPFPAKLTTPENEAELTTVDNISLQWEASQDQDTDDTVSYKVYLGLDSDPTNVEIESTNELSLAISTSLTAASTYYWKVVSIDTFGNETESQIFSFKTP